MLEMLLEVPIPKIPLLLSIKLLHPLLHLEQEVSLTVIPMSIVVNILALNRLKEQLRIMNSFLSRISKRISLFLTHNLSKDTKNLITFRIQSFSTKCCDLIINWCAQYWRQTDLLTPSPTSGIYCGAQVVVNPTYTRD